MLKFACFSEESLDMKTKSVVFYHSNCRQNYTVFNSIVYNRLGDIKFSLFKELCLFLRLKDW